MPGQASTLQTANPAVGTVSRQPQTTASPAAGGAGGAPFTRLSRQGQILGPAQAGQAFGSLWTPILKPVGGYMRYLDLTIAAVNGTSTGASTQVADAPFNVIQNLFLRDPYGQPIIQASGFSLYLIMLYGGQVGAITFGNDATRLPSYSQLQTATGAGSGNFSFSIDIGLELDSSGYCSLPSMNAASQPQLQVQFNPAATVYGATSPTTPPTLTASVDEPFWMAPVDNPSIAPPDVGSSAQWSEARAAAGVSASAFQRVVLPRVGTFIHTLILVLRDSTNARVEAWPTSDLSLWVDGVPIFFESLLERRDRMYREFGPAISPGSGAGAGAVAQSAPAGVIVYSWRASVQSFVSGADTYDELLPTTPATLLEIAGTFGTAGTPPYSITAVTGELFPVGGIPYTHLSN